MTHIDKLPKPTRADIAQARAMLAKLHQMGAITEVHCLTHDGETHTEAEYDAFEEDDEGYEDRCYHVVRLVI